jgi:tetratricopeptide (TPR) repeat protein
MHTALQPFANQPVKVPRSSPPQPEDADARPPAITQPMRRGMPEPAAPSNQPPAELAAEPSRAGRFSGWLVLPALGVGLLALLGGGYLYLAGQGGPGRTPLATPVPTAPAGTVEAGPGAMATSARADVCQTGQLAATDLQQRGAWAEAIGRLESLRRDGCTVDSLLYDAHLGQGMALADEERSTEAIAAFDRALAVKDGSEAARERELARAYQDGRDALRRQDWSAAVERLERVYEAKPAYARGNIASNLVNAYIGRGDQQAAEQRPHDAVATYRRAEAIRPGASEITGRISRAEAAAGDAFRPPATSPPAQTTASAEAFVRGYYTALDQRRYRDAYSYLSGAAQSRQSFAEFERQFAPTLQRISVRYIEGVRIGGNTAGLTAHTTTESREGSRQVTACWRVDWQLVLENGIWKREGLSQASEACP